MVLILILIMEKDLRQIFRLFPIPNCCSALDLPGGTIIIMLDESHISLHSYGEEGILAVDCFTCSKNPQNHINAVSDIKKLMTKHFAEGELMKHHSVGRFATL